MTPYVLSPAAVADLKAIWEYVADDAGVPTADRIGDDFLAAFDRLTAVPDPDLRF